MGGGGLFVVYSVCSMSIGIVMSVVTYKVDGKEHRKQCAKREEEYREYIEKRKQKLFMFAMMN